MNTRQNKEKKIQKTKKKIQKTVVRVTQLPQNRGPGPGGGVLTAKIVSLRARPIQVTHLCFPVNGVVAQVNVGVGDAVQQFDRQTIIVNMLQFPTGATTGGDPSRLIWDAD